MKRLVPTNNRPRIAAASLLMGAACLLAAGCSPRLAPIGTGGLLSRSYDNYSQSTIGRGEALMASEKSVEKPKMQVPKKESTHNQNEPENENNISRSRSEVIAPANYTTTTAAAPVTSATAMTPEGGNDEPEVAPRQVTGIPKVTEESAAGIKNITFVTQQQTRSQPATVASSATSAATSTQVPTAAAAAVSYKTADPKRVMSTREQRDLDKKRKADAKRQLAAREAAAAAKALPLTKTTQSSKTAKTQATAQNRSQSTAMTTSVATADDEPSVEDFLPGATTKSQVSQVSSALAEAVAMPDAKAKDKPTPVFIHTPANENTFTDNESGPGAIAPPTHNFKPNETEHVKFSYYDPFGTDNNRFVVVLNEQRFCYPYPGKFLSGYGYRGRSMHTGVDIKGERNDTIRAAFAGTVRMSKPYSGYGNCVVVRHKNGLETLYGHNSRNLARVGDVVQAGDPIALIGRTGRASTEHCHFEVRVQGQHINPALILDYQNHKLRAGVLSVTKQSGGRIMAANRTSGLAPSEATDVEDSESPSTIAAGGGETRLASSSASSSSASSRGSSSSSHGSSSGSSTSVYTVKSGDTLWGIAKRNGTTVTKICTLNGLDREATLSLGKKIKLR